MRGRRTDTNQKEIAAHLRERGATVYLLHTVGEGFPDTVVEFKGVFAIAEIKYLNGKPSKSQLKFYQKNGKVVVVLRNKDDADLLLEFISRAVPNGIDWTASGLAEFAELVVE